MTIPRPARLCSLVIGACVFGTAVRLAAQTPHCPQPALAPLGGMAGEWAVRWRTRVNDSLVSATDGRSRIGWVAGRCALAEDFSATLPSGSSEQHRLFAVAGDTLRMTYLDSEHGEPLVFVEEVGARATGAARLVWRRRMSNGRVLRLRYTWEPGAADTQFRTRTELSTDDGVTWRVVQQAEYERRQRSS